MLPNSEKSFRSAFDNMLEGIQILGHDWCYLYLNPAAEKHNRRPNQELLGQRYPEMWPGIEATHVFAVIKRCLKDRVAEQLENCFVYPDGTIGWFELSIQPVPEGVLILSFNITERKRAEQAQERYASRLKTRHDIEQAILTAHSAAAIAAATITRL